MTFITTLFPRVFSSFHKTIHLLFLKINGKNKYVQRLQHANIKIKEHENIVGKTGCNITAMKYALACHTTWIFFNPGDSR
jgi:hypothetical protein